MDDWAGMPHDGDLSDANELITLTPVHMLEAPLQPITPSLRWKLAAPEDGVVFDVV